jgi:hypothetical protein
MHSKLSRAELKEIIENPDAFLPRKERPSELAANPIAIHQPTAEWPTMSEAAYHGPAGDVVRAIEPHTESDKVAILIQYLAAAGNIIGRAPHYRIEGTRHHPNLFIALVGETSKARKGTSWDRVSSIFALVDDVWLNERVKSGLSTGEGLINEVRDAINKWDSKNHVEVEIDAGVTDKRLFVIEPEFAGVLAVAERPGSTLSPVIRKAWDGGILSTMTRNSPLRATGAHISLVGHITIEELRARLTRTEAANGYANRYLYPLVKRSKELPFGGDALDDGRLRELAEHSRTAIEVASKIGSVGWTTEAAEVWSRVYGSLSAGRPGLLGAVTSRAEAQCVRLALIYTVLDGQTNIGLPHVNAALAVWEYCEASSAYIFGASLGDPVADEILRALRQSGAEGMSRNSIRDLFGRHQSSDRIGAALAQLMTSGKARAEVRQTAGRPVELWFAK